MTKTGWYNKNKLGYSIKHESHRHSLAAKGVKTALPKGSKCVTICAGTSTPNFDMVAKNKELTVSEKRHLGTKEIAKRIREQIKDIEGVKVSVTKESYSGGSSISINVIQSDTRFIRNMSEISDRAIHRLGSRYSREDIEKRQKRGYFQLNPYSIRENYDADNWNNGVFLTKKGHDTLQKMVKIADKYNYDRSDPQTDYFDVNFYLHMNLGKWDKPFKDGVTKRKEVGYDMVSFSALKGKIQKYQEKRKKLKEEHEAQTEKQLQHELELAKQELKVKQAQAKTDILEQKHLEEVVRQRRELARVKAELEKGTPKDEAKKLAKKVGKEGLHLAGVLARGVAKEVKLAISTKEPKKRKK